MKNNRKMRSGSSVLSASNSKMVSRDFQYVTCNWVIIMIIMTMITSSNDDGPFTEGVLSSIHEQTHSDVKIFVHKPFTNCCPRIGLLSAFVVWHCVMS